MFAILVVCSLLFHMGCCQADPIDELMASTKLFEEAISNQDPVAAASFYAEDCNVQPSMGLDPIQGREGMVQFLKMMMDAGVKGLKLEHYDIEFTADGEMGSFWSDFTFLDADGDVIDTGKSLTTTCKEGGELKVDDAICTGTIFLTLASKTIEDEAEATIERYEEAWKNSDAEGIVALMTDDGICMLPGMDIIKGKEKTKEAMEEWFKTLGDTEIDYQLGEVKLIDLKWGYGWGYYTITGKNNELVDKGKLLSVAIRENGVLKDHRFMMNSNMYPTCPGPATGHEEL